MPRTTGILSTPLTRYVRCVDSHIGTTYHHPLKDTPAPPSAQSHTLRFTPRSAHTEFVVGDCLPASKRGILPLAPTKSIPLTIQCRRTRSWSSRSWRWPRVATASTANGLTMPIPALVATSTPQPARPPPAGPRPRPQRRAGQWRRGRPPRGAAPPRGKSMAAVRAQLRSRQREVCLCVSLCVCVCEGGLDGRERGGVMYAVDAMGTGIWNRMVLHVGR